LAARRVQIDGKTETSGLQKIDRFTRIEMDGEILQEKEAVYLMLHKPAGYLSATTDPLHPTVIELNIDTVRALRQDGISAVYGDARDPDTLVTAGVRHAVVETAEATSWLAVRLLPG